MSNQATNVDHWSLCLKKEKAKKREQKKKWILFNRIEVKKKIIAYP